MREWLVIENSMKNGIFVSAEVRDEKGYIPRDVAEAICGRSMAGPQWFTREESEKMRAHPEWRDTEPPPLTESTRPPMNDDLIARLERATEGSRELDFEIAEYLDKIGVKYATTIEGHTPEWTQSLDAALSLVPEGHDWIVADVNGHVGGTPYACVGSKKPHFAETPALALCVAALRARG